MKLSLARALALRPDSELVELHDLWLQSEPPAARQELIEALQAGMSDASRASEVRARLDTDSERVLQALLDHEGETLTVNQLVKHVQDDALGGPTVRASLDELARVGLATTTSRGRSAQSNGRARWGVPDDVSRVLVAAADAEWRDPPSLLTLHGFLEDHFRKQGVADDQAGEQARRMYRFLASEKAILGRVEALEPDLREAVVKVIVSAGGVVSGESFEQLTGYAWDANAIRSALEQASLGTVGDLDLEGFGIRQRGEVLALFNEVVLTWLQHSARVNPVKPDSIASLGVNFVSNFSRFTSFVGDQTVRFTVRGTIFKSTGKRITERLIPVPGREFRRREILDLIYRFSLAYRLIDRTGERSFRLTRPGQDFLRKPLEEKQQQMLDWLIEERTLPGDMAHQLRLRRTTLRYLKRLEAGVWYDAMFLPFVVRNHYIASLSSEHDPQRDSGSFPVRSSADLQSLAWNLFIWLRKYLYLIGVVDMGYDASGRACAFRLTQLGAQLLGMIPGRVLEGAGHIVVNPDFEVVLFPDKNSHQLVYQLDRFCERELTDSLYHYRITPGSLHRALSEGLTLDDITGLLHDRSRTPLPQNVLFSLESWARSDGMVTFHEDGRLLCECPEILDQLQVHPEIERLVVNREDRSTLVLQTPVDPEELEAWIRDSGVAFRRAG